MGHWERLPAKSEPSPALSLCCLGRNSAVEGKSSTSPGCGRVSVLPPHTRSLRCVNSWSYVSSSVGCCFIHALRAFSWLLPLALKPYLSENFAFALLARKILVCFGSPPLQLTVQHMRLRSQLVAGRSASIAARRSQPALHGAVQVHSEGPSPRSKAVKEPLL